MPHPLSALGVIHTAVSLLPIVAGLYGFVRHRAIDPATRAGKLYLLGLVLSVATSFTVSSTGGLNPGHAFGVIVLLVAFGGVLAARLRFLGRAARYLSTFALSFSFLLSLVPGVNETLTRIPLRPRRWLRSCCRPCWGVSWCSCSVSSHSAGGCVAAAENRRRGDAAQSASGGASSP